MVKIYSSSSSGYFIEKSYKILQKKENCDIEIDSSISYQVCYGFGGAITDSVAFNYSLLNEKQKKELIENVFSKEGLNYSLIRLPIGSCDFSTSMYDYLENGIFSLEHDLKGIIPMIKEVEKIKKLKIFASPWPPPKIYKSNNSRTHGGKLLDEHYEDYAKYLVNYLLMMKKEDINIDYISLQNEPLATQIWDSCIYSEKEEAALLSLVYSLIQKEDINTKIFIWDHNKDVIVNRVKETINKKNNHMIEGIAYHWYDDFCNSNLSKVHELYEDKLLFFTEGCIELLLLDNNNPSSHIGRFENGLRYAKNYILDSENYSNAFIDWNILLDEKGGPNHVGNYCEAPIMYDRNKKELIYNPSYYVISHFSKFIDPLDKRIKTKVFNDFIIATSYQKYDNKCVCVLLNSGNKGIYKIKLNEMVIEVELDSNSITTIIF